MRPQNTITSTSVQSANELSFNKEPSVFPSPTAKTSLGNKIWNQIKTFLGINHSSPTKTRTVLPATKTEQQRSSIINKLNEIFTNSNYGATLSLPNIQQLCGYVDHLQDLKELKLEAQKNIFLCILKNYNRLYSETNENSSSAPTLTNNLTTNIEKIFNNLDLNNINIKLSDDDLKVLNLASFDNNEKTNFNDLLNLLQKLHNFTGKTKIVNKIHLETLKQSIINNLNAIKREANDTQIVLPKNQTTSCIEQKQNIIDDPKATPKKSNDSQILLLKTQINYIEQEQSIPIDFLKELLKHLSDPPEKELNTLVKTIIEKHTNEQTGSTANDLPANQKENPTPPIPPQNSEKNHEDIPHNQLNKKTIQEKLTPHSQHAIPIQQPLQPPQPQPTKISINQQPKPPLTQQNETEEETPHQKPEQRSVSQNINFFQALINKTDQKTQHLQQIQKK